MSGFDSEYRAAFPGYPPRAAADFLLARLAEAELSEHLTAADKEVTERFAILVYECFDAVSSYAAYQAGCPRFRRSRVSSAEEAPALVTAARALLVQYRQHPAFDSCWLEPSD